MAHADRNQPLVPSFAVKLNGQPLVADVALWIVNVVVEDDLHQPSMFTLELISKEDDRGSTPWTDDARLALGAKVEVQMGYGDDRESLIIGEVTALEPTFSIASPPTLVVRGYDRRHRLSIVRKTRGFANQTDSNIAEQVCSDVNMAIRASNSGVEHSFVLQANQTDLEFLQERAQRIHFELGMDGETVVFRPVANDTSSVVTLTLAGDLLEFRPRLSLVPVTELKVLGWDPKQKQTITASATTGDEVATMDGDVTAAQQAQAIFGTSVETMVRMPIASQAEADQIALGRFNAAALDFIRGDGRVRGRTDLRAGRVIRLDDLGKRFSGEYYVTSVVHRYSRRDGYLTDFRVRRNAS